MTDSVTLSFRVPASKAKALDKLAAAHDRPKSYLLEKALDVYLEEEARFQMKVAAAVAAADADGSFIEHTEMKRWLESWGSGQLLPPPTAKRRAR